jgi:2-aminomuconate deaminase
MIFTINLSNGFVQRKLTGSRRNGVKATVLPGQAAPRGKFPHVKRAGDFVFVSGLSSRNSDGTFAGARLKPDGSVTLDIREQTTAVVGHIGDVLAGEGGSLADVVEIVSFLVSMHDFAGYNEIYGQHFDYDGPTRTTVAVSELPHPFIIIEMKAVAYLPQRST